jgi:hypothetical protein
MDKLLDRYDAKTLRQRFEEAGIIGALERKGFERIELVIESAGRALPHALLFGNKTGRRFLLLDGCVGEATVRPAFFGQRDYPMEQPIELAVVHWVREEDPTAAFAADRPALPLQEHPGLGVLRLVFRVIVRIAADLGKDGVASVPKFFHDAAIFLHSRLFLFLDGEEQGRFEALARALRHLRLGDASLAVLSGAVRDQYGVAVRWVPGYQVFPLSPTLTAYFHSAQYAARVSGGLSQWSFTVDAGYQTPGMCAPQSGQRPPEM